MLYDFASLRKGVVSENYVLNQSELEEIKLVSRDGKIFELGFVSNPKWMIGQHEMIKFVADEDFVEVENVTILKNPKTFSQIIAYRKLNDFLSEFQSPTLRQLRNFNEVLQNTQQKVIQNPNIYEK